MCRLLRQWREEADLSQRDVGKRLRKPHTYVHKIEVGDRRIDPIEFARLVRALDLDPVECFAEVIGSA
jgi:cytoskeletal protein RodZ